MIGQNNALPEKPGDQAEPYITSSLIWGAVGLPGVVSLSVSPSIRLPAARSRFEVQELEPSIRLREKLWRDKRRRIDLDGIHRIEWPEESSEDHKRMRYGFTRRGMAASKSEAQNPKFETNSNSPNSKFETKRQLVFSSFQGSRRPGVCWIVGRGNSRTYNRAA